MVKALNANSKTEANISGVEADREERVRVCACFRMRSKEKESGKWLKEKRKGGKEDESK